MQLGALAWRHQWLQYLKQQQLAFLFGKTEVSKLFIMKSILYDEKDLLSR